MNRAVGQSNTAARKIEQRFNRMQGLADNAFGKIAAAYASAQALRGAIALVDANTRIENSLKVAGLAGTELTRVYDSLYASAQRNAAPLESLVTLYGRAAIVQKELGVSTEELLGFTDNVALALRVAGTDAQTASGALLQLSQALGSGVVRAEEFNSILEGALPIAQAAANGLEEAGGSVAKLRGLVVEGKVSSEAFFRAFEVGSSILRDKVANSELTVSQAFIRLQNVLIDVAGKFNEGTGAGQEFVEFLGLLGERISIAGDNFDKGITPIQRFLDAIRNVSREAGKTVGADNIGKAIKESFEGTHSAIEATEVALTDAEQALVNFGANTKGQFGELQPVVDDLIQQLLEGRGTAESASEAISAIGDAGDFGGLMSSLGGIVETLFAVRDAAVAARAAAQFQDIGSFPTMDQFNSELGVPKPAASAPVSLADYPIKGGSGGSGGGGGKRSGAERFEEAIEQQRQRMAEINREIELRKQLGMAFDENGIAMEKLRVQLDLENEAARAGIELTPARKEAIDQMASAYAATSVELDRLTKAQEDMKQAADDAAQAMQDGMRGFIDDLIEGKSATEALGNALKNIGSNLLNSGLNALFGGLFGGGGGFLGGLFGGRGFATGTANTGGARGQPRGIVHGQEAVIPLPSGGRVPVDIRMPKAPGVSAGGGGQIEVKAAIEVVNGNLVPVVTQISGQVAGQQIKQNNKQLPSMMRDANQRFG